MSEGVQLLAWYDRSRRPLPWREHASDSWAVLVSEIMLQQTRTEVVARYYGRFLERFPTPGALAEAAESELLAHWSGLGYYRRARSLQAAAREIVRRGAMPQTAAELVELPGIGPYTAAAVSSIAFGETVGVIDGNVERVISRRARLGGRLGRAEARRKIGAAVDALLDPRRPGDSNQALMELGATICTPRRPRCGLCPLADGCGARRAGEVESYPEKLQRTRPVRVAITAAIVVRDGELLLVRRAADEALMPGLWELPSVESPSADSPLFAARYGGVWSFGAERVRLRHAITFRAIELKAYDADWRPEGVGENDRLGWFEPEDARALPLTGAARKLIEKLGRERSAASGN